MTDEIVKSPVVIAEIGCNHMGDLEIAKKMIRAAKNFCNVDHVKFQKRNPRELLSSGQYEAPHPAPYHSYGRTYGEHREALEFGRDEYIELKNYAKEVDIAFFSTAFDFKSADFLSELNMPAYKIASGDLTSTPLLKYIAEIGKPMILSTGGASLNNVRRAYETIMTINSQLCILQCTAAYPIFNYEDMCLKVISTYRKEFPDVIIGLSDHESGISWQQ